MLTNVMEIIKRRYKARKLLTNFLVPCCLRITSMWHKQSKHLKLSLRPLSSTRNRNASKSKQLQAPSNKKEQTFRRPKRKNWSRWFRRRTLATKPSMIRMAKPTLEIKWSLQLNRLSRSNSKFKTSRPRRQLLIGTESWWHAWTTRSSATCLIFWSMRQFKSSKVLSKILCASRWPPERIRLPKLKTAVTLTRKNEAWKDEIKCARVYSPNLVFLSSYSQIVNFYFHAFVCV